MIAPRLLASSAALILVLGLAACAAEAEEPAAAPVTETAEPSPEPSASVEEPEPEPVVFTMPADCTMILPQSRVDALAAQNLTLLGGPGSVYGEEYFFEPTPEQLAGGISCVYADEGVDLSSLLLSIAPLTPSTRAGIINDLTARGLNEVTLDDGSLTYGRIGDDAGAPAEFNLLTNETWISVISAFGGDEFFDAAVEIAEEMRTEAYQP